MITFSKIINIDLQLDGRSWITELHTSDSGEEFRFTYMSNPDDDLNKILNLRATELNGTQIS